MLLLYFVIAAFLSDSQVVFAFQQTPSIIRQRSVTRNSSPFIHTRHIRSSSSTTALFDNAADLHHTSSSQNDTVASSSSSSSSSSRWTGSGRWERDAEQSMDSLGLNNEDQQYLLKEKFGTYFKVPNPATLMTKIICTIGPQTDDKVTLGRMMDAGMTAARINMSHGNKDYLGKIIDNVRSVAKSRNKLCPIILDTKGPEIRISAITSAGSASMKQVELTSGDSFVLLTGTYTQAVEEQQPLEPLLSHQVQTQNTATVTYPLLSRAVKQGDVVLLDDGRISLIVTKVSMDGNEVTTTIIEGGVLKINKGVNLPGCHVELPHLTEKDVADIAFGVQKKVEYIAHSFTRSATGINAVRELPGIIEQGISIIAKIESQEGLDNFNSILRVSDGIMVARGDLGVEIPLERVCSVQKRIVASCNAIGKPVIVATELLDSMIHHPRPTRAEASDVANAVFDGTDCVMLSGETAVGSYPIEAIQVMTRICKEAELDVASSLRAIKAGEDGNGNGSNGYSTPTTYSGSYSSGISGGLISTSGYTGNTYEGGALRDAFAKSAVRAAKETSADLIIAITRTGLTANALAKFFTTVPIMVVSSSAYVCAQVLLHRSVTPYFVADKSASALNRESCVPRAISKAIELGLVKTGSRVLLLTGKDDMIANRLETFIVGETIIPKEE